MMLLILLVRQPIGWIGSVHFQLSDSKFQPADMLSATELMTKGVQYTSSCKASFLLLRHRRQVRRGREILDAET